MILKGTSANCAGGKTPWGSYISCEEHGTGKCRQVDPAGRHLSRPLTVGKEGGFYESFAYNPQNAHFFITEDTPSGPLQRFTPDKANTADPWDELLEGGVTHYLLLRQRRIQMDCQ